MENWNEHVLKVRASLDKASKEEMMKTVREVFTEGAVVDFQNKENLRSLHELVKVFESVFAKAGNKSIDFSKLIKLPSEQMFTELGRIAATSFWDAWNVVSSKGGFGTGIAAGIKAEISSVEAEFDALIRTQTQKMQELEKLQEKIRKKEDMAKRLNYDYAFEVKVKIDYSNDTDLKQKVREIEGIYDDAFVDLQDAIDAGKVTESVLAKFRDAAQEMLKVKNTVADLARQQIREKVDGEMKTRSKAESLFGESLVERFLGDDEETLEYEIGQAMDAFIEMFDMNDIAQEIDNVKQELVGIGDEINKITSQHPELLSQKEAADVENRLKRIQDAYDRLIVTRGKYKGEINQKNLKYIANTLSYEGSGSDVPALPDDATSKQLEQYKEAMNKSKSKLDEAFLLYDNSIGSDWEERSQYMLRAIAEYESILKNPNIDHDILKPYADTYKEFKAQESAEREKLKSLLTMAKDYVSQKESLASGGVLDAKSGDSVAHIEAEVSVRQENINAIKEETKAQEELNAAKAAGENVRDSGLYKDLHNESLKAYEQQVKVMSGKTNVKENMRLVGADGILDIAEGKDYAVDVSTMVNQLVKNLKNNIIMSLRDHPNAMDAFTPADVESFAKLYYDQGVKINGIIANGMIKTIDFTGISKEMAVKISKSFSENLSDVAQHSGLFSYENGDIIPAPDVEALAQSNPDQYQEIMDGIIESVNVSLEEAFKQNGLESTVKEFSFKQLPELTQYLLEIQKSGENAISPIEKLKKSHYVIKTKANV